MPFESEAQAAEALSAAAYSDGIGVDAAEVVEQAPVEHTPDNQVEQGATAEDSFTSIDPSALPAELQTAYKQMQADYTRKTQEIAPWRKLGDGITPETVEEAIALRESLQNPDVQRQLYEHLSAAFAGDDVDVEDADTEGFDDPRDAALNDLTQRLETFERRQVQAEAEAELNRQEAAIRESNPSWNDDDMQTVAQFALAHQGDLLKGAEAYQALQSRLLKTHMDNKASVPAGATGSTATGHAEVPQKFDNLEDAHKAAMAAWRAAQA